MRTLAYGFAGAYNSAHRKIQKISRAQPGRDQAIPLWLGVCTAGFPLGDELSHFIVLSPPTNHTVANICSLQII